MSGQDRHKAEIGTAPAAFAKSISPATVATAQTSPQSFRWRQLESTNDYRRYVANLRASGCPEATIEDIVSGDAGRAFAFERNQLGLDEAGTGPWSRYREQQLVASLLGKGAADPTLAVGEATKINEAEPEQPARQGQPIQSSPAQTLPAKQPLPVQRSLQPVYPLAFREVNLASLGSGAVQKAAIAQVQQQFVNDIGGPNQNPSDPAYLAKWQSAQVRADDTLRGLLGNQAYMAYQQQQYYSWFKPKILAAAGRNLEINPAAFSGTQ
ncbi:MAG TPA: hypothetical protein VFF11_11030 [Candidatus Binatia bacterium]|nr:hypothetical protein [Candidatus Binatia bacterium]